MLADEQLPADGQPLSVHRGLKDDVVVRQLPEIAVAQVHAFRGGPCRPVGQPQPLGHVRIGAVAAADRQVGRRCRDVGKIERGVECDLDQRFELCDLGDGPRSGLVSFNIGGMNEQVVRARLAADFGINVGANGVPYTPLDMTARGLSGIVRASVSYLNTEREMDRLTAAVATIAATSS
jgi:hypothetical protein